MQYYRGIDVAVEGEELEDGLHQEGDAVAVSPHLEMKLNSGHWVGSAVLVLQTAE